MDVPTTGCRALTVHPGARGVCVVWAVRRPTDHGVEGELLDPLLVVAQRSPAERHRGVEGRQAGPGTREERWKLMI